MARKTKVERLTNYDPAEDLGSDEAFATFMAEAFLINDAGYISTTRGTFLMRSAWWRAPREWPRLRARLGSRASNCTGRSVRRGIRR